VIPGELGHRFFEYCLQVPANRWGLRRLQPAYQLKLIQEVITLLVFMGFSALWLGETPRWNYLVPSRWSWRRWAFAFLPRA